MALNRTHFFVISISLMMLILLETTVNFWEAASLSFSLFALLIFINELGRSIAVRELIVLTTTLTMVFSPTIVLINRPEDMVISSEDYLSYGLPATLAFSIGILIKIRKEYSHKELLEKASQYVYDKESTIRILIMLGVTGSLLLKHVPVQVRAAVFLIANCLFASVLYGHYKGGKLKIITLILGATSLVYETVSQGMFGELLHYTAMYFCVTLVSRQTIIRLRAKLAFIAATIIFIIVVQSIKMEYRANTWGNTITERRADPALMVNLVAQRFSNLDFLFGNDHLFATFNRTNQGQLISETMNYVPRVEDYANGEILLHFVYPFIPRIIWSDKPITGGVANIERFTRIIHNGASSSNISPLGEAYANFGRTGGIIFMFFFGLLFNLCFHKILDLSTRSPSIVFWIPIIFVGCLTLETDVLTVWGSFANVSTFLLLFWTGFKRLGIQL
ncbi:hypothetical protein [Fibrella forsythiae]|uniref:Oligosaccharide repeat unit polymerase n=1 Tax=Fibrella forsythiae TaxID=2817061 RepID=A0ABS3JQN4_9BACT|nr:hypothetical protein [Fibrella forsythiae]MBO0952324.1 hypothetical protein [Fibrella forsythiae]